MLLIANGHYKKRAKHGARVDREKLRQIDLHWHDLRHEGACRLLSDGVDIRTSQVMLGHADIKQTQRYLNITDEELRNMTGCVGASPPAPGCRPVDLVRLNPDTTCDKWRRLVSLRIVSDLSVG